MPFITSFLAFFTGGIGRWLTLAAIVTFAVFMARMHWIDEGREEIIKSNAAGVIKYITQVQKVIEKVNVPYVKKEIVYQTVYKDLEKEAANVPSRAACNLTAGWVYYHDSAAAAIEPDPAAVADKTDTSITEAQAAGVVAENYKSYYQVANDLTACRAAITGISSIK